ncbi:hypothetical protein, partial [Staphylococcus aureus]
AFTPLVNAVAIKNATASEIVIIEVLTSAVKAEFIGMLFHLLYCNRIVYLKVLNFMLRGSRLMLLHFNVMLLHFRSTLSHFLMQQHKTSKNWMMLLHLEMRQHKSSSFTPHSRIQPNFL